MGKKGEWGGNNDDCEVVLEEMEVVVAGAVVVAFDTGRWIYDRMSSTGRRGRGGGGKRVDWGGGGGDDGDGES